MVPALCGLDRGGLVTPEQRAAKAMFRAGEHGIGFGTPATVAAWHALVAEAITDALVEAREVCTFIPDKERIGELMLGAPAAVAPDPISYPARIQCPGCHGEEPQGCPVCNGAGIIVDHGPPPSPNSGMVAFKPCGCAVDWIGDGAPAEYRKARLELWTEQGYRHETMDFREAGPLITYGAACGHDRRAMPRQGSPVLDITDLPAGGGG